MSLFPTCIKASAFDPRNGGKCINILAKKVFSYFCGYTQTVFWGFALLSTLVYPTYVLQVIEDDSPGFFVIVFIFVILPTAFSVMLIVGLHQNRSIFVRIHCIYLVVYVVMLGAAFVISMYRAFAEEDKFGWWTLLYSFVLILAHLLFFIIVRSYYLITFCAHKDTNPGANPQPSILPTPPAVKTSPSASRRSSRPPSDTTVTQEKPSNEKDPEQKSIQ